MILKYISSPQKFVLPEWRSQSCKKITFSQVMHLKECAVQGKIKQTNKKREPGIIR